MRKIFISLAFLSFVLTASLAQSANSPKSDTTLPPIGEEMGIIQVTAKVMDVDPAKHLVTLRSPQGNEIRLNVSQAVKNLSEVKKGDDVTVKYYESVAWEVLSPDDKNKPTKSLTEAQTKSPVGKKPSIQELKELNLIATITAIDKSVPNVTLKGPDGNSVTFKVAKPNRLEKLKVGDKVDITYTQALAVSLEKSK